MLKIEYLPITALTPYKRNARKHKELDISNIAKSIEQYGFDDPIGIWGEDNTIVEGHGRLMAAKELGMTEVPVIRLDHLTDKQRREYAIAHNATAELSEWDEKILEEELPDLDLKCFDFKINETAFQEIPEDLPDGENEFGILTIYLYPEQKALFDLALEQVKKDIHETFGNTNKTGNGLYEVVRQWAEQRK